MRESILKEPQYVPLRWFIFVVIAAAGVLTTCVYIGIWVQSIDSRISVEEKTSDSVNRMQEKMDQIVQRLSRIEGKIDGISK